MALLGAFYSTTIVAPYFIHPMPVAMAQIHTVVGFLCVLLGAVVVQLREARIAVRDGTPVVRSVVSTTLAFYAGAMALIAIFFLPIANAAGTFDNFDRSGGWLVDKFLLGFGVWMVLSAWVVIGGALVQQKAAAVKVTPPAQSPASGSPS